MTFFRGRLISCTHAHTCTTETRIARPPTSHHNRELPEIFLPLASTLVFPSWTAQRMSCSYVSGPPRTKSPFSVMIFCIEVGPRHIYDDTGFCHNYRHRSVISMTEKNSFGPKFHGCVFFVVLRQGKSHPDTGESLRYSYLHSPSVWPMANRPDAQDPLVQDSLSSP